MKAALVWEVPSGRIAILADRNEWDGNVDKGVERIIGAWIIKKTGLESNTQLR